MAGNALYMAASEVNAVTSPTREQEVSGGHGSTQIITSDNGVITINIDNDNTSMTYNKLCSPCPLPPSQGGVYQRALRSLSIRDAPTTTRLEVNFGLSLKS